MTAFVGENFDRATGKELSLDDALTLTGLTLQQVSDGARGQLQAKLGQDFIFPDGASPSPDNFSAFVVTPNAVTFIFQEYQVGPYSVGAQEASFPRVK